MPIVFFLFWGTVLLFLGGGWVISGAAFLIARSRTWKAGKWIAGLSFAGFTTIIALGITVTAYGWYRSSNPKLVFEDTFLRPVPAGTTVLHGSGGAFIDSAGVDLAFYTDKATFDALRPPKLDRVNPDEYAMFHERTPKWWRKPSAATEIWMRDASPVSGSFIKDNDQTFMSELTIMTWDGDGLVQYYWEGID